METQRHDEIYLSSYSQKEAEANQKGRTLDSSSRPIHHPAPPPPSHIQLPVNLVSEYICPKQRVGSTFIFQVTHSIVEFHGGLYHDPNASCVLVILQQGLLNQTVFPELSVPSCSPVCAIPLPSTF